MGELTTIALFVGMRSCEYITVPKPGRTKTLQIRDIRFFTGNRVIKRNQLQQHYPEMVTVNFYRQKNGVKEAKITMHQAAGALCPVRAFRSIIIRILAYQGENEYSTINTVKYGTKNVKVSSKVLLQHIRNTVSLIGEEKLGFKPNDVGIHSIRSSFAMFLILNGIQPEIVQLQGRWKSDAFMEYIRPKVIIN